MVDWKEGSSEGWKKQGQMKEEDGEHKNHPVSKFSRDNIHVFMEVQT